jgi:hypothetical protein
VHQARVQGSALAEGDRPLDYDVILVIDVSQSTKAASGADVDGDGVVGVNPHNELLPPGTFPPEMLSTDPEDTVLHAEIAAARALIESWIRAGARGAGELRGRGSRDGRAASLDRQDAWLRKLSAD